MRRDACAERIPQTPPPPSAAQASNAHGTRSHTISCKRVGAELALLDLTKSSAPGTHVIQVATPHVGHLGQQRQGVGSVHEYTIFVQGPGRLELGETRVPQFTIFCRDWMEAAKSFRSSGLEYLHAHCTHSGKQVRRRREDATTATLRALPHLSAAAGPRYSNKG